MALNRPGPLGSGITDSYINRRWGKEPIEKICDGLEGTYELPIFQEDIMRIAVNLAGFSLPQSDTLRKAIGKKETESFAKIKNDFINGCVNNGHNEESSIILWEKIERFARYGFNKAHSVSYAYVSYWTAWFSTYYPAHFLCELLNESKDIEERRIFLIEAFNRGIKVNPPDINLSEIEHKVINNEIFLGFSSVKFLGGVTAKKIIKERDKSAYMNKEDFIKRAKPNIKVISQLSKIGSFGDITPAAKDEIEILGFSSRIFSDIWWAPYCKGLCQYLEAKEILTKKNKHMAFITVCMASREIRRYTVFPEVWQKMKDLNVSVGELMIISVENTDIIKNFTIKPFCEKIKVVVKDETALSIIGVGLKGKPNIFNRFSPVGSCKLGEKGLKLIHDMCQITDIFI